MKSILLATAMTALITISTPVGASESSNLPDGFFTYNFDHDLKAALDPDAPEGPSLPPMWPRITIPALSTQQIEKTIRGNTIRRDDDAAVYFAPDGSLEAWINDWAAVAPDRCATIEKPGDVVRRHGGKCEQKTTIPATGHWQTRNNAVCVELRMPQATEKQCWYLALVTSKFALFDETGDMLGELKSLKTGRVLGQLGD